MPTERYIAPVSELIDVSQIPGDFQAIESLAQNGIDFLLQNIFYKDYVADKSSSSDTAYYHLVIVTKALRLPVFGTGLDIVFFKGSDANYSEFPITFDVTWPIRKYFSNFKVQGFSYAPQAMIDIFLELTNTDEYTFYGEIVTTFLDSGNNDYLTFFTTLKGNIESYLGESTEADAEIMNISVQLDLLKDEVEDMLTTTNLYTARDVFDGYEDISGINNAVESITSSLDILNDELDVEINIFREVVVSAISGFSVSEAFNRLTDLFSNWLDDITIEQVKALLIPQFSLELQGISMSLEFPRNILQPLKETSPGVWEVDDTEVGTPPQLIKAGVNFTSGPVRFDTQTGFDIAIDEGLQIDLPRCRIGNTNIDIEFIKVKLDLSRTKNIPEAIADGRPDDFIGAYITEGTVYLPTFWNQNDGDSTAELKTRNFLVGTGGVSGTIGLEAKTAGTPSPLIKANFGGGFSVSLDAFDITFQQNSIISSNIHGTMKIPGFKDASGDNAEINIDAWIGTNGEFSVTASEDQGITALSIPDILDVRIDSLTVGRKEDRFFVAVSGAIEFEDQEGTIGKFLPDAIDIQKLIVWQDGEVELEGGALVLPSALTLKIGPVELSITAIGFGSHTQMYEGNERKYKFFEFSGGVSINPGGVDARGDGIKFYYTVDNDDDPSFEPHRFVRIQGIGIDIMIPGNSDPKDAALILSGYLAMKDPAPGNEAAGTEYAGSIEFVLPRLKMGGSASMRLNPKVPAFVVDIGLEIATPIPLGATGLGIYGFRALVGQRYVATKNAAGVPDDGEWWQYYKAKISPDYKEGIQVSKFDQTKGFSL
ncbi:MAG TPA: hypothetical protein VFD77_05080, partial [Brumimicrobium sp.]|nr:hypothetical protein [Brumimicrobium sp.]